MAEVATMYAAGTISAVITRADGTVEDLGVISVVEVCEHDDDKDEN